MSRNLLVINVDIREVRVALIEAGVIAELHIERLSSVSTLGNVYLGAVSRVLPGMQAAFIDIGQERAAFLHVEDLIRPEDFEAHMARESLEDDGDLELKPEAEVPAAASNGDADDSPNEPAADEDEPAAIEPLGAEPEPPGDEPEAEEERLALDAGEPEAEAEAVPEPELEHAVATAEAGTGTGEGTGEGGRSRRRRRSRVGRSVGEERQAAPPAEAPPRGRRNDRRGRRNDDRRGRRQKPVDRNRISKSTPIREVVREGQQVIVQVTKEPIGSKGARVSSHISLPGRYVVYLPTVDHIGISKRIGSDMERSRLRETIDTLRPPSGGLVVRTVAEGLTKKQLKNDIGYLVRLWKEIGKKRDEAQAAGTKGPSLLYEDLDLVLRTARDLFTDDVERLVIDNREQYVRLRRFVEMFMPERVGDIELYEGVEPVFDAYGIEDEIGRALSRKVPLASGGYLIIDQAEALTAIDVNTGRYVGKGSKDLEETILQTNLEAVEEIAYQLRFRNIGGLIILDLIDMERPGNREKVRRRMEELLARDKAKTTLNRISELGLIEMTRKRTRESLGRLMHEPCFYCDGTGQLQSKETIAYEILRQIRREQSNLKGWKITVNAHPAIVDLLTTEEKEAVKEAERLFQRRIDLVPRKEYHLEQFDLVGG